MKTLMRAALAAAIGCALAGPALAQPRGHGDHFRGDIHHFGGHDLSFWRGGHWFHGVHGAQNGWWWIVGDQWYFYPAPVYPYPDPYVPPAVAPTPAATWYYCANPQGYYPYVAQCTVPWRPVAAQ